MIDGVEVIRQVVPDGGWNDHGSSSMSLGWSEVEIAGNLGERLGDMETGSRNIASRSSQCGCFTESNSGVGEHVGEDLVAVGHGGGE
jgi:hypothetical protein